MDLKDAKRLVAETAQPDRRKKKQTYGRTYAPRSEVGYQSNEKEDALIEAIDQKNFLMEHADWITKLRKNEIDVPGFLGGMSPDTAIELASMVFDKDVSDKTRLAAIQDLLDRAGYSKVQKHAIAQVDPNAPKEQLISMIEGLVKKNKVVEIIDDDDEANVHTEDQTE